MTIDYQGIALIIAAVATAVPIVGGFVLSVLTFRATNKQNVKLTEIAKGVDGVTTKLVAATERAASAEGKAEGVAEERAASPLTPDTLAPGETVTHAAADVDIKARKPRAKP